MARIIKTRNCGTMTEAGYFGMIRSILRRGTRYAWLPMKEAKNAARIVYNGSNKRRKWSYVCAKCGDEFMGKDVQVDHIKPVGTLRSLDDIPQFINNLTQEDVKAYQIMCKPCHKEKTKKDREAIKRERDGKAD